MTGGHAQSHDKPPMHPMLGLLVSLIMPWRACQDAWRTAGLWQSLLYHVLGLVLFAVGLTFIDAALWYGDILDELFYISPGDLPIMLLFFVFWVFGIELSYFFTAWWTSCWGADIERYRESISRSLFRWYQLTPFHALWTLVLIASIDIIDKIRWDYWDSYSYGSHAYDFWEFVFNVLTVMPFAIYFGIGGWFTLRALAVHRSESATMPKCRWPAVCETCGYALVGLAIEQTCPECGRSVQSSLDTPRGRQPLRTLAKMRMALFNPAGLGNILLTRTRTPGPAAALATTALLLLLSGPIGIIYIMIVGQVATQDWWIDGFFDLMQFIIIGGLSVGISVMTAGVMIVLGAGSVISLIDRLFGKRNNLPAACQAACYASGYVLFTALLMYGFTGVLIAIFIYYENNMNYTFLELIPLLWFAICLLLILPFLFIVGRIVKNTRFANT